MIAKSIYLLMALFIVLVVSLIVPGQVGGEKPDDVVRIDANLVTLQAEVMDRSIHASDGLTHPLPRGDTSFQLGTTI